MKISDTQINIAVQSFLSSQKPLAEKTGSKVQKEKFSDILIKEVAKTLDNIDEVRIDRVEEARETVQSLKTSALSSSDIAGKLIGRSLVDNLIDKLA